MCGATWMAASHSLGHQGHSTTVNAGDPMAPIAARRDGREIQRARPTVGLATSRNPSVGTIAAPASAGSHLSLDDRALEERAGDREERKQAQPLEAIAGQEPAGSAEGHPGRVQWQQGEGQGEHHRGERIVKGIAEVDVGLRDGDIRIGAVQQRATGHPELVEVAGEPSAGEGVLHQGGRHRRHDQPAEGWAEPAHTVRRRRRQPVQRNKAGLAATPRGRTRPATRYARAAP